MKISLIHPSRSRPAKAKSTYQFWIDQSSGKNEIEHILCLDHNDPQLLNYDILGFGEDPKETINDNSCVVEATNHGAKLATGDILIYLSDDFKCPKDWDELIIESFGMHVSGEPSLLKVDDCLQPFHVAVLTIPIMNQELYKKLGYFWHPGYKSMFVDEDLFWTCKNNGWLIEGPELKFPHEHFCNGKAENDETYTRSAANWDQGKAFFAQRKLDGFPI